MRGHLYVGHLHGKKTPQLERLNALLDSVIPSEISDNITGVLWSKLTYTCLGYFGSLADAALITTCSGNADRHVLVDFFAEVVAVGKAAGARFIPLAEYNPLDFHPSNPFEKRLAAVNEMAKGWNPNDRKGPLRQLQKGIKTEVDYTLAHVVREGEKLKISTPLCRKLLDMIHELEAGSESSHNKTTPNLQLRQKHEPDFYKESKRSMRQCILWASFFRSSMLSSLETAESPSVSIVSTQ